MSCKNHNFLGESICEHCGLSENAYYKIVLEALRGMYRTKVDQVAVLQIEMDRLLESRKLADARILVLEDELKRYKSLE